ncbi:MAG: hypothetical protein HC933_00335 [Pleurocapsa sp. SU_196_0]|nr:hypothetical protein [Pleurocapsa sp. SU_196_0]
MKLFFKLAVVLIGSIAVAQSNTTLLGAGASYPAPLYTTMFTTYAQQTGTRVRYDSSNSRTGQANILERKVDFGASDAFLTNEQLKNAPGPILHIPMAMVSVVMAYNLPTVRTPLNLNGDIIARIYLGTVKRWNDPALQQLNPRGRPARSSHLSAVPRRWERHHERPRGLPGENLEHLGANDQPRATNQRQMAHGGRGGQDGSHG